MDVKVFGALIYAHLFTNRKTAAMGGHKWQVKWISKNIASEASYSNTFFTLKVIENIFKYDKNVTNAAKFE